MANPVQQEITLIKSEGVADLTLAALANAAYLQKIEVMLKDSTDLMVSATFEGSGENNSPMPVNGTDSNVWHVGGLSLPVELTATFSNDSGSGFRNNPANGVAIIERHTTIYSETLRIQSEDGGGPDMNDSILTLSAIRES